LTVTLSLLFGWRTAAFFQHFVLQNQSRSFLDAFLCFVLRARKFFSASAAVSF